MSLPASLDLESHPTTASGSALVATLDQLETALAAWTSDYEAIEKRQRLIGARREAARTLAARSRREARGAIVTRAAEVISRLTLSGVQDAVVEPSDEEWLHSLAGCEWPAMLGAMILTSAWRWPAAPLLGAVPDRFWGEYAAWLFAPPRQLQGVDDADVYLAHAARHLDELNRWIQRNPGSAAVRAAAEAYLGVAVWVPACFARHHLGRHAAARGLFLTRHSSGGAVTALSPARPRIGRRLRVGFVSARLDAGSSLRRTAPGSGHLDPRSFETILISTSPDDSEAARQSEEEKPAIVVLAGDIREQVADLRSLALDVVVFCADIGTRLGAITQLASQRVAPLQVVVRGAEVTTGLPEIDLWIGGEAAVAEHNSARQSSERLGVLRGSAIALAPPLSVPALDAGSRRAQVGLPEGVVLFAAFVSAAGVTGDTLELWARTLAACPDSRLVLVREADARDAEASSGLAVFCPALDRALAIHGVASERVTVFPVPAGAPENARALLALADIYLDAPAGSEAEPVAAALAAGRPVVTLEVGANGRRTVAGELLRSLAVEELIASNSDSYVTHAAALATDAPRRGKIGSRIQAAIDAGPGYLDELAAGDAVGTLLETAFDELEALGPVQFRAQREPLRCFAPEDAEESVAAGEAALAAGDPDAAGAEATLALRADPHHAAARALWGRVLLAEGDASRAVTYLLAAVERRSEDAGLWLTLADALRQNRQGPEAVQALETSLRLDRTQVDAWLMLREIAEGAGATEIAQEAVAVLREIAPDDPRVSVGA